MRARLHAARPLVRVRVLSSSCSLYLLVLPSWRPRVWVERRQAETRWDRFAKEKGIMGSKRSRMMWDDEMKEWKPRHGYKRANDGVLNHAIVEVKPVST